MRRLVQSSRFGLAGAMAAVLLLLLVQIAQAHTHPTPHAHGGSVHGGESLLLAACLGAVGALLVGHRTRGRR